MRWFKMVLVAVIALAFSTPAMAQEEKKNENRRGERETPEQTFKKIDADGDGKATKDELTKWVESNERMSKRAKDDPEFVNNMFKRMDDDGDGKVNLDEYKKWSEAMRAARKKKDPAV